MLSTSIWLSLSRETRNKLEEKFGIGKSAGVEVAGNQIVCDGHNAKDLEVITIEKLQQELDSKDKDFYALFQLMIEKIENLEVKPLAVDLGSIETLEEADAKLELKKKGRPAKAK